MTIGFVLATGCGGGGATASDDLSPAASAGRTLFRGNGCNSCHGANGEGNIGPALIDVFGSDVELADGTEVVADRAYLVQSIMEPGAAKVAGFGLPMPVNNLDAEQVDSIVDYIVELGGTPGASGATP